jgi:hypothetical protein
MSTQEKQSFFSIAVLAASALVFVVLIAVTRSQIVASSAFALTALLPAERLIDRRERRSGRVIYDERDAAINTRATNFAHFLFWLAFVAAAMAPFFILGPNAILRIKTTDICFVIWCAVFIVILTKSIATIVLYRKSNNG